MTPELIEYGIRREPLHKRQAKAYMEEELKNRTPRINKEEDHELIRD